MGGEGCSLLVIATIMADDPAPKRVRRTIGTVCEACGKHFATSDGFDKRRTSGYLVGTPCHGLDDGSTRAQVPAQLVATSRQTMSTAVLQKLKLRVTHIAADNVNSRAAKAETPSHSHRGRQCQQPCCKSWNSESHGTASKILSWISTYPWNLSILSKISINKCAKLKPERVVFKLLPSRVLS